MGCSLADRYLDLTAAVANSVLNFSGRMERIEDVLGIDGGLEKLEESTRHLDAAKSPELHSMLFDERDVILHAPIQRPQKLIGIGLNYRDHIEETKMEPP